MKKQFLNAVALGFLSVGSLNAQTDSSEAVELEQVVISLNKTEQNLDQIDRSVTVISEEEIANSGASNLSEVLRNYGGFNIIGSSLAPGSIQGVFMRGASGAQVLIAIDGVRVTDPSSVDNGFNLAEFSLLDIERIEIVKGSHSTMYGPGAVGGMINIITKSGKKGEGFKVNASLQGGAFSENGYSFRELANVSYTLKNGFYLGAGINSYGGYGFDATTDTITRTVYKTTDEDNFSKLDYTSRIGYKSDRFSGKITFRSVQQSLDLDDGMYSDDDNHTSELKRNMFLWNGDYKVNDHLKLVLQGGYSSNERNTVDDSSATNAEETLFDHTYSSTDNIGSHVNTDIYAVYEKGFGSLVFGGSYYGEQMNNQTYTLVSNWTYEATSDLDTLNLSSKIWALYSKAKFKGEQLSEKLKGANLSTGLRFNSHDQYGSNLSYEITPSYSHKNATLFASVSTGFNAPALYRLYNPSSNWISGVTRGNPNLKPELSTSYEVGVNSVQKDLRLSTVVYHNRIQNSVQYVYLWDGAVGIDTLGNDWMRSDGRGDTYLNLGTQLNTGVEIDLVYDFSKKLKIGGNVTLVSTRLEVETDQIDDNYTQGNHVQLFDNGAFVTEDQEFVGLNRRANTANLWIAYQVCKNWTVTPKWRYRGERGDAFYDANLGPWGALGSEAVGDYALFDLNVRGQISKGLSAVFLLENIANTQYQEIIGYNARGRGAYLTVNYALK